MKKQLFNELVAIVQQAGRIHRREKLLLVASKAPETVAKALASGVWRIG